MLITSH
ncbi:unnamed protein product, partial [Rotaria sp. Silwood2]